MSANNSDFKGGKNIASTKASSYFLIRGDLELVNWPCPVHMSITCTYLYLLSRHVESTIAVLCGNRWNFEKIYHLVNLSKSYFHFDCDDFKIYCKIQNFEQLSSIHTYNRRSTLVL